jgi:hypothetical protein
MNDLRRLTRMNNRALDFLLFRELSHKGLDWYERTVQARHGVQLVIRRDRTTKPPC